MYRSFVKEALLSGGSGLVKSERFQIMLPVLNHGGAALATLIPVARAGAPQPRSTRGASARGVVRPFFESHHCENCKTHYHRNSTCFHENLRFSTVFVQYAPVQKVHIFVDFRLQWCDFSAVRARQQRPRMCRTQELGAHP